LRLDSDEPSTFRSGVFVVWRLHPRYEDVTCVSCESLCARRQYLLMQLADKVVAAIAVREDVGDEL
jgi:hypothetical protein